MSLSSTVKLIFQVANKYLGTYIHCMHLVSCFLFILGIGISFVSPIASLHLWLDSTAVYYYQFEGLSWLFIHSACGNLRKA